MGIPQYKIAFTHDGIRKLKETIGDSKKRAKGIEAITWFTEELDKAFPENKFAQRFLFWLTDKKLTDFLLHTTTRLPKDVPLQRGNPRLKVGHPHHSHLGSNFRNISQAKSRCNTTVR